METTRLVTIKTQQEIPDNLKEIIKLQVQDNKIEAVVIKLGDEYIRITKGGTYSDDLKITKEQPKKEVKKWKVSGEVLSAEIVPKVFKALSEAESFKYSMESIVNWDQSKLEIEEFVELVDEEVI